MTSTSKRKGDNAERYLAKLLNGTRTYWQPDNTDEERRGDIDAPYLGRGEVKVRGNGFKQIYDWITGVDFLAIKADRRPWLVVMTAADLKDILDELDELKRKRNEVSA